MYGLKSYLVREGLTQAEFAERIGITPEYLSRILCGHVAPSEQLRRHIELETQGEVRA